MPLFGRTTSSGSRPRPRAVWAATITGLVLVVLVVAGVLLPVLGLIGAADGATAGALDVPVGPIGLALLVGYALALLFLLGSARSRNGALAWVLSVSAVIAATLVSVWPLLAVALAGVDQAGDVVPFIQDLIARVTGA
jgi:succinate dehydrogenase hydrophobic anchor subunit